MKPKTILNGAILFIGLGLAAYSQLNGSMVRTEFEWFQKLQGYENRIYRQRK